jgi:hypothetical protein
MSDTQKRSRFGSEAFKARDLKTLNKEINDWLNTYGHQITVIGFSHAFERSSIREYSAIIAWRHDP